ncbi:MAG: hypothetical protein JWO44_600 [Bacteroidetes bacterium]|nr:hypothetical protein [Bacteroidota bacterium]
MGLSLSHYFVKSTLTCFLLICSFAVSRAQVKADTTDNFMEWRCIVIAARSHSFSELDKLAKEISKKTGIPYDNKERIYDKKEGIILPDDPAKYGIDAGQSFPRRFDEQRISIEMAHFYDEGGRDEMILVTGIFSTQDQVAAEAQQKLIYDIVPKNEIVITQLYMGCTH